MFKVDDLRTGMIDQISSNMLIEWATIGARCPRCVQTVRPANGSCAMGRRALGK